ncbi:MAG: MGMT family protein [Phycisphaeraceae bacterium]
MANAQTSDFHSRCWDACRRIPRGSVTTYGRLAAAVGSPGAARAAGRAMACNPYAPEVPCHRVVATDGRLTGYSGAGGVDQKAAMLAAEGVPIENGRVMMREARVVELS